jgi:spore maturation protein CgeB
MRIFLVLHPSANLSVTGSMTWYNNLYEPLKDLGNEVYFFRLDEFASRYNVSFRSEKFREILSYELIKVFRLEQDKKPIDLFFSYLTDQDIDTNAIKQIKAIGIPMVNFSCNNIHQFYLVEKISPLFDFNLHSEKAAGVLFKSIGANPVWFPMAANPNYYFPTSLSYKYDVSFVGAAYSRRVFYIWHLLNLGIDVNCFGPNWLINKPKAEFKKLYKETLRAANLLKSLFSLNPEQRYKFSSAINYFDLQTLIRKRFSDKIHYPLGNDDVISVYNKSKINLGFLEVYSENQSTKGLLMQHLHLREFEVPMSRGLYITNFNEELCEFYEPGKEILVFYNEFDLAEKIRYYLANESEAEVIRERGYQRAKRCHTYQKRLQDLFFELNL